MKSIRVLAVVGALMLTTSYAHAQGPRYAPEYQNQGSANPGYSGQDGPDYSNPNYSNPNYPDPNYNETYSNPDYDSPGYAAPDYAGPEYSEPAYGPPPTCAYGYYSYYPYACAPSGYYGAQWFSGGVFIGAGPWIHGYYGRPGYRGPRIVSRAPRSPQRAPIGGFRGSNAFHGSGGFRGGSTSHGGSESHGGGFHGGGSRGGHR
jgi:hypothetical protein